MTTKPHELPEILYPEFCPSSTKLWLVALGTTHNLKAVVMQHLKRFSWHWSSPQHNGSVDMTEGRIAKLGNGGCEYNELEDAQKRSGCCDSLAD
jgi:hypothetical protein